MGTLPDIKVSKLAATRDYLREVSLVLGSLQRVFLPPHPRLWQHGLEVSLRGLTTQAFTVNNEPQRATLDLVKHKVRLDKHNWLLRENPPAKILANVTDWLVEKGVESKMSEPELSAGVVEYEPEQTEIYAESLWWMQQQFSNLQVNLKEGVTSPILLYPHHFDLSLVWFPWDDDRQVAIGYSTGDDTVPWPYIYITAYPEPKSFKTLALPKQASWQTEGFSGAILPYEALVSSSKPAELFERVTHPTFKAARDLLMA